MATMPPPRTLLFAAVTAALVVVHTLLPSGPLAAGVYTLGLALATGLVIAGVRRNRPRHARPWQLLAAGFAIATLSSVGVVVCLATDVSPTPMSIGFLAAWVVSMSGAWSMVRRRSSADLGAALDTAIVTTGAAVLMHVFVVQPTWDATVGGTGEQVVAVIYPLLGVAVVAVFSRLVFGGADRAPAFWLLAAGLVHFLVADLTQAIVTLQNLPVATGVDSIRLLGFLLIGAGPYHPSIDRLTDAVDPERARLSRPRLLTLWAASVATPLTLLVRAGFGHGPEPIVIATGSVVLFTLVVARMWGLLGTNMRLLRREHENRFRALVEHAEDVIALVDEHDLVTYVSTSVGTAFGYEPEAVLGHGGLPLDGPTGGRLRKALDELRAGDGGVRPVRLHGRVRHADGGWRQVEAVLVDRRSDPAIGRIVITIRDVTAQRELEQQLTHQAFHDALTGLPNRALFVDRARQALDVRRADATLCAVLFLDLDDFKTVNDSLGHDQGDALLQAIGERLAGVVRGEDTVARLGGDEFAILVPRAIDPRIVIALAERVLTAVSAPIVLAGRTLTPDASLGIAVSDGNSSVDELLRDADAAMYAAKRQGKGTFRLFDPGMHAHAMHRLQLRTDLFGALEREELFVVYHEIQDLDHDTVAGVEALLRWRHPTLGLVPPAEFVPIAEESGRIGDLGVFVLRRACREVQALRADGRPALFLTVNVSPLQLESPGFVDEVSAALADSGLPAASLVLELTERVLLEESEAVADALARLRATGVRLAIDDFGTGYCSLAYLTRLPFDIIKVDQSFVSMLGDVDADHRVTVGIVELIHSLAVPAVAEGIETEAQLQRLRGLGCRYGQGFLWGRPVPADELSLRAVSAPA
ncbi:MAG TPA: EAL domain-containing protein [Egicoccus sp.]|nr:EAL domain-containing protein [Egicoccus sp.]HSK25188.1 EAL domain-containing protein [Egicoccus sp.]